MEACLALYTGSGRRTDTHYTGRAPAQRGNAAWTTVTGTEVPIPYRVSAGETVELLVAVAAVRRLRSSNPALANGTVDITALIAQATQPFGDGTPETVVTVPLRRCNDKGGPGGSVLMTLRVVPHRPAPPASGPPVLVRGLLRVKVVNARSLPAADRFTRHDPFVRLILFTPYAQASMDTGIVYGGGANPTWREKHGNQVQIAYTARLGGTLRMKVEVWDADLIGAGDMIGQTEVDVSRFVDAAIINEPAQCLLRSESSQRFAGLLNLSLTSTRVTGVVVGDIRKQRPRTLVGAVRTAHRVVYLRVWAGRSVGGNDGRARMSPYVVAKVLSQSGEELATAQCLPVRKGGANPRWMPRHGQLLRLEFDHAVNMPVYLQCHARGKETLRHESLGVASMHLGALLQQPVAKQRCCLQLRDPSGVEDRGELAVTLAVDTPPVVDEDAGDDGLQSLLAVEAADHQPSTPDFLDSDVDEDTRHVWASTVDSTLQTPEDMRDKKHKKGGKSGKAADDDGGEAAAEAPRPAFVYTPDVGGDEGGSRDAPGVVVTQRVLRGRLAVHVKRATGLPRSSAVGHQDPIVRLTLLDGSGKPLGEVLTDPALGAGQNPTWPRESAGLRHFRYHVPAVADPTAAGAATHVLSCAVFDQHARSRMDPIAVGHLDVTAFIGARMSAVDIMCPLLSVDGRDSAGTLRLLMASVPWDPVRTQPRLATHGAGAGAGASAGAGAGAGAGETSTTETGTFSERPDTVPDDAEFDVYADRIDGVGRFQLPAASLYSTQPYRGAVEVAVLQARHLQDVTSSFSGVKPYVTMSILAPNGRVMSTAKTGVAPKGGQAPRWKSDNICRLQYEAPRMTRLKLECSVWHARSVGSDLLLGQAKVAIPELVGRRHTGVTINFKLTAKNSRQPRGVVFAVVSSSVSPPAVPPQDPARTLPIAEIIGTRTPRIQAADLRAVAVGTGQQLWAQDHQVVHTPVLVHGPWLQYGHRVLAIAAGGHHSLAITSRDGAATSSSRRLWAWGCNSHGQLGVGDTTDRAYPVEADLITSATSAVVHAPVSAAAGSQHSVIATGASAAAVCPLPPPTPLPTLGSPIAVLFRSGARLPCRPRLCTPPEPAPRVGVDHRVWLSRPTWATARCGSRPRVVTSRLCARAAHEPAACHACVCRRAQHVCAYGCGRAVRVGA